MAVKLTTTGQTIELGYNPTLSILQEAVGGYIEGVPIENGYMYVNEEGKMQGLPVNVLATNLIDFDDIIVGDVVILEVGEGEDDEDA